MGNVQDSRNLCHTINTLIAAEVKKYPNRFKFMAALPIPDAEGSIEETKYAIDELGAVGVKVPSNV